MENQEISVTCRSSNFKERDLAKLYLSWKISQLYYTHFSH